MNKTVGECLKKARLDKGLTLEQVSRALHIRTHYLTALEEGQPSNLPSPVQGRGFLRLYADYLNLDVPSLLAQWEGKPSPVQSAPIPSNLSSSDQPTHEATPPTIDDSDTDDSSVVEFSESVIEPGEIHELPSKIVENPPESVLIFRGIGRQLQETRVTLGLSLADVERFTKLRQRYLQAIEDGKFDDLPSPVQGRGMLSNYARFLELDSEKILLKFADGLQRQRLERNPDLMERTQKSKNKKVTPPGFFGRVITPDLLIGGGVILFLVAFILWGASRVTNMNLAKTEEPPPSISKVLISTTTAMVNESTNTSKVTRVAGTPVPQRTALATATLPPINTAPLQVYIVAQQRAWMRVIVDGKTAFDGRIITGNAYPFSGSKQIEVLTGNAAAIQVFFNQTDLGTIGVQGQVVGLVFTPKGILTPTSAATSTPQATRTSIVTTTPTRTITPTFTITPFIP
ncbi:MAG TPA: RodZ domain-containing protein [Anaerolineaceae bacterium]